MPRTGEGEEDVTVPFLLSAWGMLIAVTGLVVRRSIKKKSG